MKTLLAAFTALVIALAASGYAWADTSAASGSKPGGVVNLELKDVSVVDAVRALFDGRGLNYSVEPGVKGKILELVLNDMSFDQARKALFEAAGLTYEIEDGIYLIRPEKPASSATAQTTPTKAIAPAATTATSEAANARDWATAPADGSSPDQAVEQPTEEDAVAQGMYDPGFVMMQPPVVDVGNGIQLLNDPYAPVLYNQIGNVTLIEQPQCPWPSSFQAGNVTMLSGALPVYISGGNVYPMGNPMGYPAPSGWGYPQVGWGYGYQNQPYWGDFGY